MRKNLKIKLAFIFAIAFFSDANCAGIVAKIGKKIITTKDINDHMKLMAIDFNVPEQDIESKKEEIISSHIDSFRLMEWFILNGNHISQNDRIEFLKLFCQKIEMSQEDLFKKLEEKGISQSSLQTYIDLLFLKEVALPSMLKSDIKIHDQDIQYTQNKIEAMKHYQYEIEEIYIGEKMSQDNKNIANKIESDLKNNPNKFGDYVAKYSNSISKTYGGYLGVVTSSNCAYIDKIKNEYGIQKIYSKNGVYVINVKDIKPPKTDKIVEVVDLGFIVIYCKDNEEKERIQTIADKLKDDTDLAIVKNDIEKSGARIIHFQPYNRYNKKAFNESVLRIIDIQRDEKLKLHDLDSNTVLIMKNGGHDNIEIKPVSKEQVRQMLLSEKMNKAYHAHMQTVYDLIPVERMG